MCFCKTFLDSNIDDKDLLCNEYHVFRDDRIYNGKNCRGGGVMTLVPGMDPSSSYGSHYCSEAVEGIATKINFNSENLIILNVYRPPSSYSEKHFVKEFGTYFFHSNLIS